ncbi:hypothetical protein HID58_086853, partial [Brassica napus]
EIRIGAEGQEGKNQELSGFDWVSGKGNFGIFWPVWVIKWSTISIIIKTKSREFTGMVEMITTVDSQNLLSGDCVIQNCIRLGNDGMGWESQYSPRKEWGCDIVVMASTRRSQWKYMGDSYRNKRMELFGFLDARNNNIC